MHDNLVLEVDCKSFCFLHADKFTVLSFLEALEDSVSKSLEPDALGRGINDPMDEGQ